MAAAVAVVEGRVIERDNRARNGAVAHTASTSLARVPRLCDSLVAGIPY